MISNFELDDSNHVYVEVLSKDGTITLIIIDDDYTSSEDVIRRLKAESDILPKMVIWLSFCKAYEFFAQTTRLRTIKEGNKINTIDIAYTLILLDLRADKGMPVWDFQEEKCESLKTPKVLYGLEILKFAKIRGYNLDTIWIYSSYQQSIVEAEMEGIKVNEKNSPNFLRVLKARIHQWPVSLDQVTHQQWRELRTTEIEDINHWPDVPALYKSPSLESALIWANEANVSGHSIQSILGTTNYPNPGERNWGEPYDLIPAPKWIAAQDDLVRDGRQTTCAAIRYFNHVAKKLSGETLAVSIAPHFKQLTFNPYPLALWLQGLTQSLSSMPIINDQPNKTQRTNDCFVHLELWESENRIIGTVQEGFVSVHPHAYPLKTDGRIGRGMPQILNLAALCGISELKFHTRIAGRGQTRIIDTLSRSVAFEDSPEDLVLRENEILLNFEFDIGA
jgi:hypothetical protein